MALTLWSAPTLAQGPDDTGALLGRVIDQRTGRPVNDAAIMVLGPSGAEVASSRSQTDGSFELAGIPAGIYRLEVEATDFRPAAEPSQRVIAGKTQVVAFELAARSGDIEEVIVVAARALDTGQFGSVSSTVLNREEIRRAPGTAGDIFRGLNQLPGVVATGEFSNFSVRGRGPRDNLILIDDIPYDRTVHFDQSLGETEELGGGGRFSIFGQNVIGRAEFQPGGWEAAYGGANGSLLRLGLAEGNSESPFFSIKADLAGAELLYDGPTAGLDNTSMLVSARYYNFGPLFDLIGQDDLGTPELADLIVKTTTELTPRSTLSVLAIYTPETFSRDAANVVVASENFEDIILLETEQHAGVIGATLEQLVGEQGELRNSIYLRFADDDSRQGEAIPEFTEGEITADSLFVDPDILRLRERESELGWRLDYSTSNRLGKFSAGSRLTYLNTNYEQSLRRDFNLYEFDGTDTRPTPDQFFVTLTPAQFDQQLDENALRAAVYLDQQFDLGNFSIIPGLRADYDELLSDFNLSPRLSLDWQLRPSTRLSATAGVYIQAPRLLEIAANAGNLSLEAEKMRQFSVGLEQYFGDDLVMLLEGYFQDLDQLLTDQERVTGALTNEGVGETYGVDWSLRKRFSNRWSASARYGYNRARRDFRDGQGRFDADFNRPHVANITLNYEPGKRWAFAAQYQYASGAPTDQVIIRDDVLGEAQPLRSSLERVARNVDRLDAFSSLNVRVDYRQRLRGLSLIAFVDVINVLGSENQSSLEFSPVTGEFADTSFTTFPQLGITVEF
ncbi:MAG: TonB-dependent receptor [Pseudomonadota bacterium]